MSRAMTAVGVINVTVGGILLMLDGFIVFEIVTEGFGDLLPFVLPFILPPAILTALSGWAVWYRRKWGRILMIVVGAGWSLGLGCLAYNSAVDERNLLAALLSFLGAIYGLVCVLMMMNRANRSEFA